MKVDGNELKPGNVIKHKGRLWLVVKTEHVKPGKGGAFTQVELKDAVSGNKLNERFRSSETVERVRLDDVGGQYLHAEGDTLVFMDTETYDQIHVPRRLLGRRAVYLEGGMIVKLRSYEGEIVAVEIPDQVVVEVEEADPAVKGQTATNAFKSALLANGLRVMVPTFVLRGEKIVVDTRDDTYVRRSSA